MNNLEITYFDYKDKCFVIKVKEFDKIHDGSIKIKNSKTGNEQLFEFISRSEKELIFENKENNLKLIINGNI
jgi:hypothetical protein